MNIDYLSDDENIIEEKINNEYNNYNCIPYEEEEYDDDEEYNEYINQQNLLILNAINKKILSTPDLYSIKKEDDDIIDTNEKLIKVSKNMSLDNFNKHMDKVIQDAQPKKFISQRLLDKKQLTESTVNEKKIMIEFKRHFNPRLPPYFQVNSRFKKD
jgi:hypothetical protein